MRKARALRLGDLLEELGAEPFLEPERERLRNPWLRSESELNSLLGRTGGSAR